MTLAKSIGGGLPVGAFGGTRRAHGLDHRRQGAPPRHVQRQPARHGRREGRAGRGLHAGGDDRRPSTATVATSTRATPSSPSTACPPTPSSSAPRAASPGRPTPVRNYRDYKATDFDLAFAQWIWGINRGVLLPTGLDEQWLISVLHDDDDVAHGVDVFRSLRRGTRQPDGASALAPGVCVRTRVAAGAGRAGRRRTGRRAPLADEEHGDGDRAPAAGRARRRAPPPAMARRTGPGTARTGSR